jgi:glyoxylase-like metal-dependent hydrolase (beta-lactamase superfamily II)
MALASLPAVRRLLLAEMTCPDFHPTPGENVEVFAYLVEHPDGAVLVDTGVGSDNDFLTRSYRPRIVPLAEALAEHDRRLSDVVALVNSHLHFDAAARQPHYTVREWFDFEGAALRIVDGEAEILPGLHLLPTPGHSPGHQSLLVEGGGRRALVGAQAAYTLEEWGKGVDLEVNATQGLEESYVASFERLRQLEPDELYLSHDRRTGPR